MTTKYFLPLAEIRKLATGSYEQLIVGVDSVVQESSKALFGEEVVCEIVGTFPDSVIVLSEDGRLVRAKWERAEDGTAKIVSHQELEVPRYSAENREEYARLEVRRAVRAWQEGRVDEAQKIISEVAPYVDQRDSQDDSKVVEMLAVEFKSPRPWRTLLQTKASKIRPMIGEAAVRKIESQKAAPKFTLLYNGTLTEEEILGYRDLVESDFRYLTTRVKALRDLVKASYEGVGSVVRSEELKEEDAIKTFVTFSEDLISDLRRLHQVVSEATQKVSQLDSLGKLFDVISEGMQDYEVAGRFVEVMSRRLIEATK